MIKYVAIAAVVALAGFGAYALYDPAQQGPAPAESPDVPPGRLADGVVLYSVEEIPQVSNRTRPLLALNDSMRIWTEYNPHLVFEESSDPNVVIRWQLEPDETWSGYAYCNHDHNEVITDCTVDIAVGGVSCSGTYVQTRQPDLTNLMMHEFGHVFGIGHTLDESHLMYSEEDPEDPLDERGMNVPDPLPDFQGMVVELGEKLDERLKVLGERLEDLDKRLEVLDERLERLDSWLEDLNAAGGNFDEYNEASDAYNIDLDRYNEDVDRYNEDNDRYNEDNDAHDVMVEEVNAVWIDPCFAVR